MLFTSAFNQCIAQATKVNKPLDRHSLVMMNGTHIYRHDCDNPNEVPPKPDTVYVYSRCGNISHTINDNSAEALNRRINEAKQYYFVTTASVNAVYPGGEKALLRYLSSYVPDIYAVRKNAKGKLRATFYVNPDGTLGNITANNYYEVPYGPESHAVKFINGMPCWKPAMRNGNPVAQQVSVVIPVKLPEVFSRGMVDHYAHLVTDKPSPNGEYGMLGFWAAADYVARHLRFPNAAVKAGITGTVQYEFTATAKGKTSDIRLLHGIGYGCEQEVLKHIKTMPDWIPAKYMGKPVAQTITINTVFHFRDLRAAALARKITLPSPLPPER
ncbi:MAG: energy transducer TonB [Bacteroidota bacterium]